AADFGRRRRDAPRRPVCRYRVPRGGRRGGPGGRDDPDPDRPGAGARRGDAVRGEARGRRPPCERAGWGGHPRAGRSRLCCPGGHAPEHRRAGRRRDRHRRATGSRLGLGARGRPSVRSRGAYPARLPRLAVAGDRLDGHVCRSVDRIGRRDDHPARLHVRPAAGPDAGGRPPDLRPRSPPGRRDAGDRAPRGRRRPPLIRPRAGLALLPLAFLATAAAGAPQPEDTSGLEPYLKDRGRGIATSMFGTYIRKGEWIVYPFYEYTKTTGFEYAPEELGFTGSDEHFGTLTEHEWLLWVAYGLTDRLEVEVEGALHASATFEKAPDDLSAVPPRIEESGLGDVE